MEIERQIQEQAVAAANAQTAAANAQAPKKKKGFFKKVFG
jgi:hypothetical protein